MQILPLLVQLSDLWPQGAIDQYAHLSALRHQLALKRRLFVAAELIPADCLPFPPEPGGRIC